MSLRSQMNSQNNGQRRSVESSLKFRVPLYESVPTVGSLLYRVENSSARRTRTTTLTTCSCCNSFLVNRQWNAAPYRQHLHRKW